MLLVPFVILTDKNNTFAGELWNHSIDLLLAVSGVEDRNVDWHS
jgi:hypothetical protein